MKVLLAVLLVLTVAACTGDLASAPASSPSASPAVPSPTAPSSSPSPTARAVELSTAAVAGVPLGTSRPEAEQRLTAELGAPTESAEQASDCNGEQSGHLAWDGGLVVFLTRTQGGLVLGGWSARESSRFAFQLPFGTRLGETAIETRERVPGAVGSLPEEGPYADTYLVRSPDEPDLLWLAAGPGPDDAVDEVSFRAPSCD